MVDQGALIEDRQYLRQLLDGITEHAVIPLDDQGVVCGWYEGARRLTQYSAEEILGRPITVLFPSKEAAQAEVDAELRAAAGGRYQTEGWRARKDGSLFWASVMMTPVHGEDGRLRGYVKVAYDRTQARELELELRSTQQMLDSITDYEVVRLDLDGAVRSWNIGAQRLTGYRSEEVMGRHVSVFYPVEDVHAGLPEREIAAVARDGFFESEGWRLRRDGTRFWANVVYAVIQDEAGSPIGYVKVARDQTERREQEQVVRRQRDEILELSTPVIQVWDKVLVLPLIGTLDSARAARLTETLLERIGQYQAEVVILDVSGVPAIDTGVAQHLLKTAAAARLMGTVSILSGVRPETAQSIVHLGIELGSLRSRNTLKDALQLALRLVTKQSDDVAELVELDA